MSSAVRACLLGLLLLLLAAAGCHGKRRDEAELAPLTARAWRLQLEVPGFGPATVALPLGATRPRPIVVIVHGDADRPEWQCGNFRGLLGGDVFIVCPRGQPAAEGQGRFGLGSVGDTDTELRAALASLKSRFGAHVAKAPVVLIGYAAGARHAAALARQAPSFFARVALLEGDPSAFTPSAALVFASEPRAGKRVLFFATDAERRDLAAAHAAQLSRRGVATRVALHAVGPWFDAAYAAALAPDLAWLLAGDARFTGPRSKH